MSPKQTTLLRGEIFAALDPRLAIWDFGRKKSSFEWFRRPRPGVVQGIHLNCAAYESVGRLHIIPTLETGLELVEAALVESGQKRPVKDGISFGRQLTTMLRCEYIASIQEGSAPIVARLAADIERHGLPCLEELSSLERLAESLALPTPHDWPILLGRSQRARLLPLVLALMGRTEDAIDCLGRLRQELAERGELQPDFDAFGAWLQRRCGSVRTDR